MKKNKMKTMGLAIAALILTGSRSSNKNALQTQILFQQWKTRIWVLGFTSLLAVSIMAHKKVNYPLIENFNTQTLDITGVELTDQATTLTICADANFAYHNWISIGSKSYLQADGKEYRLTGAKDITPDSLLYLSGSDKVTFTLFFEPLPENTETFDFIGLNDENGFKLYGIDLTGKQTFETPENIPGELLRVDRESSVPSPIFKTATTTLHIHFLYYRPELYESVNLYVNTLFGEQETFENIPIDPATATATFRFLQYGTVQTTMSLGNLYGIGTTYLVPGEETDIYIDLRLFGYFLLQRRHEEGNCKEPEPFQYAYSSGTYTNLNAVSNVLGSNIPSFNMNLYSNNFADYRMTSAEYVSHVTKTYQALEDSIEHSGLPALEKELAQLTLKEQVLHAISDNENIRLNSIHGTRKMSRTELDPLKAEDAKIICTLFDINDPKLLMGRNTLYFTSGLCKNRKFDWAALAGIERGLVKELGKVSGFTQKAVNIALTDSDFAQLEAMDNPFYLEAFTRMQDEAKAKLAVAEVKVMDTPNIPNEQLFDALIAPYKGKVVLVDFWNTWCAPCRAAIKATEPLKSVELKSNNLVWLYIADESSPLVTYNLMVSEIQGVHYRLNKAQRNYIYNKFGINAIPSYVLVDKKGEYSLRNDFSRDHNIMKQVLKEKLEE